MNNNEKILKELKAIANIYQAGNFLETISKSKKLLRMLPNNEFLTNMVGLSYINIGYLDNAKNLYLKMIKISPSLVSYQNNYANVLKGLKKFEDAEKLLKSIIEKNPNYIGALNNLANLKKQMRKFEEAIDLLNHALKIEPSNVLILYNIALCFRSIRKFDEVLKHASLINEIDPKFILADKIISEINNYKIDKINHFNKMEKKLINKDLKDEDKATLLFAFAKANEDKGNYEKAANLLKKANYLRTKKIKYNFKAELKEFSIIKKIFTNLKLPELTNYNKQKKIIFICGLPRSGTTLVEQIISSHPEVFSLGETDRIQTLINKNFNYLSDSLKNITNDYKSNKDEIYKDFTNYIERFDKIKNIFTDKSLLNFKFIGFIKLIFPNSKIIVLKRDFNNNFLSIFKSDFQAQNLSWTYNDQEIKKYYNLFLDYISFWDSIFPESFIKISYSDLVNETEINSRKLIKYCNLQWNKDCLEFYKKNNSPIDTASANQANKPVYKSSLNKFKNYKDFFDLD